MPYDERPRVVARKMLRLIINRTLKQVLPEPFRPERDTRIAPTVLVIACLLVVATVLAMVGVGGSKVDVAASLDQQSVGQVRRIAFATGFPAITDWPARDPEFKVDFVSNFSRLIAHTAEVKGALKPLTRVVKRMLLLSRFITRIARLPNIL
mmetsp:Transcript_44687/g.71720  ORF Transcript_44687/g.71720 Transcript_44687/m.71720 type:complete len:152 (+) Transcript_44687:230-685(+)